ncbi:hypothetical protein [Micromonospora sp. NPDC057140]
MSDRDKAEVEAQIKRLVAIPPGVMSDVQAHAQAVLDLLLRSLQG